jgi:putative hemolysin
MSMGSPTVGVSPTPGSAKSLLPVGGLASRFLPWKRLEDLNAKVSRDGEGLVFGRILRALNVRYSIAASDVERIPQDGGLLVVANHPFGMLDGVIAGDVLLRVRKDVKILTNRLLGSIPWLAPYCIWVDPFGTSESARQSQRGLREAIEWLRSGGALFVFPAGEVSHWKLSHPVVTDPPWLDTAARLANRVGCRVLPLYFHGRNSVTFQALGVAHPRLRTLALPHEFLRAAGKSVDVAVGTCVSTDQLRQYKDERDATTYLRWRTYLLRERGRSHHRERIGGHAKQAPIAGGCVPTDIIQEVEKLPPAACLCRNGDFSVYLAGASEVPNVLNEIGRLREITFRAVGEGSGREIDLDRYDQYYKHLFVWDQKNLRVVGGYRLAETEPVLETRGLDGLYTNELFKFHPDFFRQLGPALELGRSFVRQEYQRQYAPLLVLWKAIATYVTQHPEAPVLFGPVSISNAYSKTSRELLVRFFEQNRRHRLAPLVKPRAPFRASLIRAWEIGSAIELLNDADELNAPLADIEPDGKETPILLRQYLKVGGSVVAFNVDRNFSSVLDALIAVDLRQTSREVLNRYMGAAKAAEFLRFHNAKAS